ncbi:hypothetical protein LTR53_015630 [Teratosphaeriaceae sp. CCFEE 6253]|nr:hypothetical protein LTR53_015630 [Teratosphaeriaceae sp. CCFEE 6253]
MERKVTRWRHNKPADLGSEAGAGTNGSNLTSVWQRRRRQEAEPGRIVTTHDTMSAQDKSGHATQLDHVIILVPYKDITDPPIWVTDHFILSPGGRHVDNKTENRLILFADGTYIELIAFIDDDPEKRRGHWWDLDYGIVDFALGTAEPFDYPALQERLESSGSGVSYAEPQAGGRRTPDGQELKWKVTFPLGAARGEVPFWCHDVTPRERRVPVNADNTKHPCGAVGMAGINTKVPASELERFGKALFAITDETRQDDRYPVGCPVRAEDSDTDLWIRLQSIGEIASDHQLSLTLRRPQKDGEGQSEIRADIGGRTVVIDFEK